MPEQRAKDDLCPRCPHQGSPTCCQITAEQIERWLDAQQSILIGRAFNAFTRTDREAFAVWLLEVVAAVTAA